MINKLTMSTKQIENLQNNSSEKETEDDLFEDDGFDEFCENLTEEKSEDQKESMTVAQKARSDRNKLKAVMLKQARVKTHPYADKPGRTTLRQGFT